MGVYEVASTSSDDNDEGVNEVESTSSDDNDKGRGHIKEPHRRTKTPEPEVTTITTNNEATSKRKNYRAPCLRKPISEKSIASGSLKSRKGFETSIRRC